MINSGVWLSFIHFPSTELSLALIQSLNTKKTALNVQFSSSAILANNCLSDWQIFLSVVFSADTSGSYPYYPWNIQCKKSLRF